MTSSAYKVVCLGGGNAAGYLAKDLAASPSFAGGDLAIITDEPVRGRVETSTWQIRDLALTWASRRR